MAFGFPQPGTGFPAAASGEEPPGDPQALRRAARALGRDAEDGFTNTSDVLDTAVRDVTGADWNGSASRAWAFSAGSLRIDAFVMGTAAGSAAGVLSKLATEIQEAKDRAARARGRAEREAEALASAERGLTTLAGQEEPDPQATTRLTERAGEARGNLQAANDDVSQAAEDARRAARSAAKELNALTGEIPEPVKGLGPVVPVTPTRDPLAARFDGRPANVFASPFSNLPGDVRRRQIEEDEARAAAEAKEREGGIADRFGGEFEGLVGFRLFGDPKTEGYQKGKKLGTVVSYFPTPASLSKLVVKQGGRRVFKMGAKEGGEEAGERGAKKGAASGPSNRRDAPTPGPKQRDIDPELARKLGELGDFAGVPQAGTAGQLIAAVLNEEVLRYVKVRIGSAADRARRLREDAPRQLAALRVAAELRRSRPDVPQGFPRDVPAEVRPR